MRDFTFEAAFRHLFVYNILFEDAEVDGQYFGLDEHSRVLGISAAGCGLASMLRFSPQSIDAVDINGHHLALAALRMAAAQRLDSFDELYDLFGLGWVPSPERTVASVAGELPPWMQKYWRRHSGRFGRAFYEQGLTATMLRLLRRELGVGTDWMTQFVQKGVAERVAAVRELLGTALRRPLARAVLNSPLQQLALGVNFSQKSRMLDAEPGDLVDYFVRHCERVAATDCTTNWFAWYALAGHYNHERADAVPPYLRKSEHERSKQSSSTARFHHKSIFEVLVAAERDTWTHYSLCDAVDWMSPAQQQRLLDEIVRTSRPGARVLMRTVSETSAVEELGQNGRFRHLVDASRRASAEDRSRQYRRVDFFEVCA